jgi:nitrogen fixation/metabolism regulation signal transduction histidine kinase
MLRRVAEQDFSAKTGTLRTKILAFVGALVMLSVLGSTISLYRITEVNALLDTINRVSVPLSKLFTQMQSDADVYARELERGLGHSHWNDPHWRPRPTPQWIEDVLEGEVTRVSEMIRNESAWAPPEERARFAEWAAGIATGLRTLRADAAQLYAALAARDMAQAQALYPRWTAEMEEWRRQVQWGASEYERELRGTFRLAQTRADELRTGLELVLIVVVMLSLLVLWLGERALRPLAELTMLARNIARRGLRKGDKAAWPEIPIARDDEVSALSREFHRMATALLEREKTVEAQKHRLQENNRQLKEIGELNENILLSIESVLIVTDLAGRITQCNPLAVSWLLGEPVPAELSSADPGVPSPTAAMPDLQRILGTEVMQWPRLQSFFPQGYPGGDGSSLRGLESSRLEPRKIEIAGAPEGGRVFGGYLMPLRSRDSQGVPGQQANGAIIVLQDLTDDLDLQERLRHAENLAAVGRMSAQVAHEVRNPLHSIGLEAEVAVELAASSSNPQLKQSLQSILSSVDRLEKITDNYLKLSRLSAGHKSELDLGDALESVLATYASACEAQGVQVDWAREPGASLVVHGDRDLLEQVFGNLLRNALQSLESSPPADGARARVRWALGATESGRAWLKIEDNGPGIPADLRGRLFTPFVTTRAQGTGLGLSFVKQVIEDHGGTIVCLDREPGRGACFEMVFPQHQAQQQQPPRFEPALPALEVP